jgi:hypothetical protein
VLLSLYRIRGHSPVAWQQLCSVTTSTTVAATGLRVPPAPLRLPKRCGRKMGGKPIPHYILLLSSPTMFLFSTGVTRKNFEDSLIVHHESISMGLNLSDEMRPSIICGRPYLFCNVLEVPNTDTYRRRIDLFRDGVALFKMESIDRYHY